MLQFSFFLRMTSAKSKEGTRLPLVSILPLELLTLSICCATLTDTSGSTMVLTPNLGCISSGSKALLSSKGSCSFSVFSPCCSEYFKTGNSSSSCSGDSSCSLADVSLSSDFISSCLKASRHLPRWEKVAHQRFPQGFLAPRNDLPPRN